jgi:hypothetical protein
MNIISEQPQEQSGTLDEVLSGANRSHRML